MPFKSKAQQRWMFATNPEKAREWADETKDIKSLPEKKNPQVNPKRKNLPPMTDKTASEGLFFEKRSQSRSGRFFRDLPGRDDATFHEKAAFTSYPPGTIPSGGGINVSPKMGTGTGDTTESSSTTDLNIGATGGPVGGMGQKGEGMSGGMYGTGEGDEEKKSSEGNKALQSEVDRLQALLEAAAGGAERKASSGDEEKTAGKTPDDWDADSSLPTGFHRPANEQPEALEPGGERFHSTTAKGPAHGLIEGGSLHMRQGTGHQMGKHASAAAAPPRFLGTSFALQKTAADMKYDPRYGENASNYAGQRWEEAKKSLGEAGSWAGEKADEGVKAITRSPAATVLAAALLGKAGFGALRGLGRRVARGGRVAPPPSLAGQALGGIKKLISGR
jgi:hypothetical protein